MTNHHKIAQIACEEISRIGGISKLLLFGSLARNAEEINDMDIAVILDDNSRSLPLDLEGFPQELIWKIKEVAGRVGQEHGIRIDICPFWESQYEKGVKLCGDKYNREDNLKEVGVLMYDVLQ